MGSPPIESDAEAPRTEILQASAAGATVRGLRPSRLGSVQRMPLDPLLSLLGAAFPRWQVPDEVLFVDDIPLGATGKIDKILLRERFVAGRSKSA